MLDTDTKRRIDNARDILVGKLPDPKSQVEQITIALIYKFMDDMDKESIEMGGKAKFFSGDFQKYAWSKIFDPRVSGIELVNLYGEAIQRMNQNPNIPQLFRDIFKNAYLPYRDPETLKSFLKTINDFKYDHSERLGDAFEYLLSVLGSQGEAGQFRTPRHIIDFMVEIIDPQKTETILDPACGTAGFLISSYKHILKKNSKNYDPENDPKAFELHGINLEEITVNNKKYRGEKLTSDDKERLANNILGYDISPDMVRLSLVNMYLHGFSHPRIYEYDTLTSEDKWNEFADVILANPPFMSPKGGIKPHKRFSIESKRSEVLFVDYIAEHLTPQGKSCVIVPEGIIFQSQTAYRSLRKMLVEKDYLVGIISLPAGVFNPYSNVKTSILWFDRNLSKKTEKVLFVKIENDGFDLGAQRKPIKENDMPKAFRALLAYKNSVASGKKFDVDKWSNILVVSKQQIINTKDYALSGDRYRQEKPIQTEYPMVSLEDIVEVLDKLRKPVTKSNRKTGVYPYYGATGIVDYVDKYIFDERLVLIGEDGAKWGSGEKTAFIAEGKYWVNNHAHVLRPIKGKLIDVYLIEMLNHMDLTPYITGVTVPKLNQEKLRSIKIPLPPLDVQKALVSEIENKRKAIEHAQNLIKNLEREREYFGEIFREIKCDWVELGDICVFKRGPFGGSLKKEIFVEKGYCVYEQSHAISGQFEPVRYFINHKKFEEMKQFEIKPGDLIMSCSGTMGKVAIVPEQAKAGIINQALLKLTPSEKIDSEYLKFILEATVFQKALQENTYGAAIKNVASVNTLKKLKIPLPSIDIQKQMAVQRREEDHVIDANKKLIEMFEQKIKDRIAKIWSENS